MILCLIGFSACVWWLISDHTLWGAKLLLAFALAIAVATCRETSRRRAVSYLYRDQNFDSPLEYILMWIPFAISMLLMRFIDAIRTLTWVGYIVTAIVTCFATALIMIVSGGNTTGTVFAICTGSISFGALIMAIAGTCPQKTQPVEDPCCEGTCEN